MHIPYRKIVHLAGSPFLISALLAIPIFFLLRPATTRYSLNLDRHEARIAGSYNFYFDLNDDGHYEKIYTVPTEQGYTPLLVKHNDGLEQINLNGNFYPMRQAIRPFDINGDGSNELIVLTATEDSVYLTCYNPIKRIQYLLNLPITSIGQFHYESHPDFQIVDFIDHDDDGIKEIVISVNVGFPKHPRRLFVINAITAIIESSPESSQGIQVRSLYDFTGNRKNDFLLRTDAYANCPDTALYSDHRLYLMLLNHELQFLFEPILMGHHPATLFAEPISDTTIFLLISSHKQTTPSVIKVFNLNSLRVVDSLIDNESFRSAFLIPAGNQKKRRFMILKDGFISVFSDQLKMVKEKYFSELRGQVEEWHRADLNGDGQLEIICYNNNTNHFIVARKEFRHVNTLMCDIGTVIYPPMVLYSDGEKSHFVISGATHDLYFNYTLNSKYWLQYAGLPMIYLSLLLVLSLIYRWQRQRILLKVNERKRIEHTQFSLAMNQFDSHFTLNIMSAVASLYESHKKSKADKLLSKYLKHLRNSLIHSNESLVTVHEELEYVKNYLSLESGRLMQGLEYNINVQDSISSKTLIPRNLIYTFIENSVKHGLSQQPDQKGVINIELTGSDYDITITIQDNGIGRKAAGRFPVTSTGLGLKIINDIIDFHQRYSGIYIHYSYNDLFDPEGNATGTKVNIHIKRAKTWTQSNQ